MNVNAVQRDSDPAASQADDPWREAPPAVSEGPGAGADLVGPAPRSLAPLPGSSRQQTLSVALFPGHGDRDLLAFAWYEAVGDLRQEFVWLEPQRLRAAAGNILPLVAAARQAESPPSAPPWTSEARRECLQELLQAHDGDLTPLLRLLAAALDERGLLLEGQSRSTRSRLALVQALMALLPADARALLGFASNVNEISKDAPAVLFSDATLHTSRWRAGDELPLATMPGGQYVALLAQWWDGETDRLLQAIDGLGQMPAGSRLAEGLDRLAQQHLLVKGFESGRAVPTDEIKALLGSGLPVPATLLPELLQQLLQEALDRRDGEAARLVALHMDADPALDASLGAVLVNELQHRPDAVYVFVRAHLATSADVGADWRRRLQAAALCSLQIAICEADAATIVNWLRLVAHEPPHYELASILRDGLLAARGRAHDDGELALQLLELALRHTPEILEDLLADEGLLAALPDNAGLVLRDHAGDPLLTLQRRGPEFFLIAIARATQARVAGAISSAVLEQVWLLYRAEQRSDLPACFRPEAIVEAWLGDGPQWLPPSALGNLAALLLADGRDSFFIDFSTRLAEEDLLAGTLPDAAHRSQRSSADLVTLFGQLPESLPRQILADTCLALLRMRAWSREALPAAELLARLLQQDEELRIGDDALWQLLEYAGSARDEMVARSVARRIFSSRCGSPTDPQLMTVLLRLQEALGWSPSLQLHLTTWWRAWARSLGTADLSRLDESLAASRHLARKREIVQTILAFRRMLGNHSMAGFAATVDSVFDLLQHLSAAFDPRSHQPVGFDEETFRAELAAGSGDLSPNARAVLAHDLRELALLISAMGDQRSHNTLVRPNIERQVLAGEHNPESAVDAMKWIAAWLEHARDEAAEDPGPPGTNGAP